MNDRIIVRVAYETEFNNCYLCRNSNIDEKIPLILVNNLSHEENFWNETLMTDSSQNTSIIAIHSYKFNMRQTGVGLSIEQTKFGVLFFFIEIFQISQLHTNLQNGWLKFKTTPTQVVVCNPKTWGTPKHRYWEQKQLLY